MRNIYGPESVAVLTHGQTLKPFKFGSLSDIVDSLPGNLISISDPRIIGGAISNLHGTEVLNSIIDNSSDVNQAGLNSLRKRKVYSINKDFKGYNKGK